MKRVIEAIDLPEGICEVAFAHLLATGGPVSGEGRQMPWMSAGGDDLSADFCTPTVLLCSEEHGRVWSRRQADNGRLLALATAADEGRQRWAGCARAARWLGQAE